MKAKRYHVTTILIVLGLLFAAVCACWATLTTTGGDKLVASGTVTQANMKISAVDGTAFVDFTTTSGISDLTPVATGSVTQANMRISAVDGTAFLDFSTADVLTDHVGKFVRVKDSAGKWITGWIKAAGSGETLGGEALTNPSFDVATTDWGTTNSSLASIAGGETNNCLELTRVTSSEQSAYSVFTSGIGALFKLTAYVKSGTSGDENFRIQFYDITNGVSLKETNGTTSGTWTNYIAYGTSITATLRAYLVKKSLTSGTMLFDTTSTKQVLTPSATGVTIVSTNGGTTYNYTSKDSDFNYNDSSGYTYQILSPNPLPLKLGHKLQVCDSTGKCIQGYIKAAGTGETLDSELVTNGNMEDGDPPTGWSAYGSSTLSSVADERTGGAGSKSINAVKNTEYIVAIQAVSLTNLALYKHTGWGKRIGAGGIAIGSNDNIKQASTTNNTWTELSYYFTRSATVGSRVATMVIDTEARMDDVSMKKVLTPSATGATITTTKVGSTYNWTNKVTGFNYNDASGYTYRIYKDSRLVQVATGSVTQANTRLSLVDGAGFVELNGVDLTAYQSGLYMIAVYDSANRNVTGFISAAPGGEALGAEINTGTLTANKLYKIVTTEANHFFTGCAIDSYFTSDGTETCDASNTVKEVTDCAVTGGLIVSAFGGATRNWNNKNAAFGRKDLTGYSYKVWYIGN